jgi:hypothetical protein
MEETKEPWKIVIRKNYWKKDYFEPFCTEGIDRMLEGARIIWMETFKEIL